MTSRSPLPAAPSRAAPSISWIALAGLVNGVFGGVVALCYLILDGLIRGDGPWRFANLFAATWYPARARHFGFSWATVTGIAAELVVAGLAGVLFALLLRRTLGRGVLRGAGALLLGFAFYYLGLEYLWSDWNPRLVVYQPFPGFLLAHLIFGFTMTLLPRVLVEIQDG